MRWGGGPMKDIERAIRLTLLGCIVVSVIALTLALFLPKTSSGSAGSKAKASGESSSPGPARGGNGAPSAIAVETLTLAPSAIAQRIRLNGDVASRSRISLYADTAGKLVSYQVSIGSAVRKGEVVAFVDPSRPGAPYASSPVRSTIAGTVIALPYTVGDTVSTSSPIAAVGVLDDIQIITYVPEKYVSVLRKGLVAEVSLVAWPGEIYAATVTMVSPVVDTDSRTVEVRLMADAPPGRLRHGMFAVINLVTRESRGAVVVPKRAVRSFNGERVVYVIGEDLVARRVPVKLGLANDAETELISGVVFGERVVVSGSVSDGTPVRLTGKEAKP